MSQFDFLATLGLAPERADSVRRLALRAFLSLLVINAAIAIAAIVGAGEGGDTQWRILGTSAMVTGGSLVLAANAGAIERRRLGSLPLLSATVACIGFAGVIWGIWDSDIDSEWFWKTVGILVTIGVAGTYVSMISLPRLRQPWPWAQMLASVSASILAGMIVVSITTESDAGGLEAYAVLTVLLATSSIVVAVGARVATVDHEPRVVIESGVATIHHCPVCGSSVADAPPGSHHSCSACGTNFQVLIAQGSPAWPNPVAAPSPD
jgi:peptidoglycan/LPS O-acetylase OafA/YrhL